MSNNDELKEQNLREIRINPIVPSDSVVIATARNMRPRKAEEPAPRDTRKHVDTCPFCKGNEDKTPETLSAFPDEENWQIRIVENLYPVLGDDADPSSINFGLNQAILGYGRHEVIIDHSNHGIAIHEMEKDHLSLLFKAYRERMKDLYASDKRLKYVLVFKNFGPAAGASIPHTHSQLVATPVVPENVHNEVQDSHQYYNKHHKCIFCTLIDEALTFEATIYDRDSGQVRRQINVGQYVIEKGEHFIAIKPFASRYEWEVHILPLEHQSDYTQCPDEKFSDLAQVLKRTMARLETVIGGAQYNYFLHSLPRGENMSHCDDSYHWHIEICPRTTIPSGFELGSGFFVNTISPEYAAARLRGVELDEE
jgi:UDPglucose--hexose-1-phosphate uridylyltransferase